MSTFGELLKIDRERLGISQEELAKRVGVSQQAVANWENGTSHPRKDRRTKLLEVLGPDAELVKNPPTTDFVPAEDNPYPQVIKAKVGAATARGVTANVTAEPTGIISRAMVGLPAFKSEAQPWVGFSTAGGKPVHIQPERTKMLLELQSTLPEPYQPNVGNDLMFGQVARQYDYASSGVVARVMRAHTVSSPTYSAIHIVRLAMAVRSNEPSHEPTGSVVLFILSEDSAAVVTRRMGAMHFDAMTLGINIEVVPDVKVMAKTIVDLERAYAQDVHDFNAWMAEVQREAHEHVFDTDMDPLRIPGRQPSDAAPPPNPDEGTW